MNNEFLPKWMINTLGALLIIFLILLCLQQWHALKGPSQTMNVTATGKATMVPDLATVTIGVVSDGASAIEVKDKNNQKINQMIAFIKQQGVDDKDIQTTTFYSSPKYNYTNGQNNIIGFTANQTVTIKIRAIDKSTAQLEKVIDGAVMNGANQVQGINFSFSDDNQLSQTARKQAIELAQQKAHEIANVAGLKLGRIVNVMTSESGGFTPRPYAMAVNVATKSTAPNIEPGSQDVSETVTVVFDVH